MMGLTSWGTVVIMTIFLYVGFRSVAQSDPTHNVHYFPPPLSVGKSRNLQSTSQDASMFTQTLRRRAVASGKFASPKLVLRESPHTSGFTNGVLEYQITSLCQYVCGAQVCPGPILDAGTSTSEYCTIFDGGAADSEYTIDYDGGNAETEVC